MTYTGLLLEEEGHSTDSRLMLESIQTAAMDAAKIIAQMRDLYRVEPSEEVESQGIFPRFWSRHWLSLDRADGSGLELTVERDLIEEAWCG